MGVFYQLLTYCGSALLKGAGNYIFIEGFKHSFIIKPVVGVKRSVLGGDKGIYRVLFKRFKTDGCVIAGGVRACNFVAVLVVNQNIPVWV